MNNPNLEIEMPLSHYIRKLKDESKVLQGGKNLWILKPVGLNRGQGIHVIDSIKKCKKLMKEYYFGKEVVTKKVEQVTPISEPKVPADNGATQPAVLLSNEKPKPVVTSSTHKIYCN